MTEKDIIYKENRLRRLTEGYFDGTLSPEETEELLTGAADVAEGRQAPIDADLGADLRTIYALGQLSASTLLSLEERAPAGFEERLDAHISRLAFTKRRKWVWLKAGAAAACAALLVTAGWRVAGSLERISPETPAVKMATADASPAVAQENTIEVETLPAIRVTEPIGQNHHPTVTGLNVTLKRNRAQGMAKAAQKANGTPDILTYTLAEASIPGLTANVEIPMSLADMSQPMTTLLAASEEVVEKVVTPITTMGATLNNMMEALDFVNAIFYDAHKTASVLSSECLQASAVKTNGGNFRSI